MRFFAAILMTGGRGHPAFKSVEVFHPSTSTKCLMSSSLMIERAAHSQDSLLACGGLGDDASCEEFSPATGTWAFTNHTLLEGREYHVSWAVEEGTILMGGLYSDSMTSSEIVKHDGTTERSFDLKYQTR